MRYTQRSIVWSSIIILLVLLFIITRSTSGKLGNEMVPQIIVALLIGGIYELGQRIKHYKKTYHVAFGIGFLGLVLLGWVSGAVGIIGSENNPANLMYRSIPVLLLVGSIISRLRPQGMKGTLLLSSFVQIIIPFIALFIWPAKASRGDAGVIGVFIVNTLFTVPFIVSALLFSKVSKTV